VNAARVYKLDMSTETSGRGSTGTVRVDEPVPGVRVITLDRPHRLNAMSGELISDLHRALDDADADEAGRVVVLTGTGRGSAPAWT
jgi:enoyl-CoA hydratase/carnithine racemase